MITAQVGDRVVEEERQAWTGSRYLRFRVVVKVTKRQLTTGDGAAWDRETGRSIPRRAGGEVRDVAPGDAARAVREVRRARVRSDISFAERYADSLTDDEVAALDTVLSQIAARLRASVSR